jgi:Uma2 family endonuclease
MSTAELSIGVPLVTADELLRNFADIRCDLIDGRVDTMAPSGDVHGVLALDLGAALAVYVRANKLGRCFAAETGFLIARNPDTVMAPDCAFVRADRLAVLGFTGGFFPEAPALAVEVTSPSDTAEKVADKARRWLAAGCEMVWVVYPRGRSVTVYKSLDDVRILTGNSMLDGGEVLPGFSYPLAELFAGLEAK